MVGAVALALTVGVMARRAPSRVPVAEDMRDAVAAPAPVTPAMAGGVRVIQPSAFASPASRRAEAEAALLSSRLELVAKAARARAAKHRRAAAQSVTAQ